MENLYLICRIVVILISVILGDYGLSSFWHINVFFSGKNKDVLVKILK